MLIKVRTHAGVKLRTTRRHPVFSLSNGGSTLPFAHASCPIVKLMVFRPDVELSKNKVLRNFRDNVLFFPKNK